MGNSRFAECRSYRKVGTKTRVGALPVVGAAYSNGTNHVYDTNRFARNDFLLVFYSDLSYRRNRCRIIQVVKISRP